MIVNEILEFEYTEKLPLKTSIIEDFIKSKGIDFVRYSLLKKEGNKIIISVSGVKNAPVE